MTSEQIKLAAMTKRETSGLKVTLTDTEWVGYFKDEASRDEFVGRATAQGRPVKVD